MNRTEAKKERMERVRQMFLQKIREEDMAKEMGVSVSTVNGYISEMGLKRKDRDAIRKGIIEMYSSGREIKEIMDTWKVSKTYINKIAKRNGLTTRRNFPTEKNLIDENTKFADNRVRIERIVEGGKRYVDILPLISPR